MIHLLAARIEILAIRPRFNEAAFSDNGGNLVTENNIGETLIRNLQRVKDDWNSIQTVFSDHFASNFLSNLVTHEINELANSPEYVVRNSVSQTSFIFINDADFEYSVRIMAPLRSHLHPVKWLGMPQIIGVRGPGFVLIRTIQVPSHIDITCFQPSFFLQEIELVKAVDGDIVATQSSHQILDIRRILSPVIVEILTYRRGNRGIMWTFNHKLKSLYAEQSSLNVSRFRNVLELAHMAGKAVPDEIYNLALDPSRPHIALLAIQSMLMAGHPDAFVHLQRAIDSEYEDFRQGAQLLFDSMMTAGGGAHAP